MEKQIVLKKSVIITQDFAMAFQKLVSTPLDNSNTAYWVSRIFSKLRSKMGDAHQEYQTRIVTAFAEKDENGKPVQEPGQAIKIKPDQEKECQEAIQAFEKETVHFDHIKPVALKDLSPIKFSARELEMLEGIFEVQEQ